MQFDLYLSFQYNYFFPVWEGFHCLLLHIFSDNPMKLQHLANLPLDAPLWVQMGRQDELAEAELKYIGSLTRGGSAVFFGVQLKVNLDRGYNKNV